MNLDAIEYRHDPVTGVTTFTLGPSYKNEAICLVQSLALLYDAANTAAKEAGECTCPHDTKHLWRFAAKISGGKDILGYDVGPDVDEKIRDRIIYRGVPRK